MKSKKTLLRLMLYFLLIPIFILCFFYFLQEKLIFIETRSEKTNLSYFNEVKDISFNENGVHFEGYIINADQAHNGLVFYYGGNAEDVVSSIIDYIMIKDRALIFFNYRGYGKSTGKPSQESLFNDADLILKKCINQYEVDDITLIGRSLGSGVACYLASENKVSRLILVTPYDSILKVAGGHYPFLPVSLLLKHPFRSDIYIQKVNVPILVFIAGRDRVIPNERSEALLKHMKVKPQVVFLEKSDHNNVTQPPEFRKTIKDFFVSND